MAFSTGPLIASFWASSFILSSFEATYAASSQLSPGLVSVMLE
jgi:hypothetical protein